MFLERYITPNIQKTLDKGNSVLVLGPRQTGKTTLIKTLKHDKYINLMDIELRQTYERSLGQFSANIKAIAKTSSKKPVIIVDEIQKIPVLTDAIQLLIDDNVAQFILTGSSARSIKNLLPGRVIKFSFSAISILESKSMLDLENILANGMLPKIVQTLEQNDIEQALRSYVSLYLEEEIRKEAVVRNITAFSNFLKLAAIESGNSISFRAISQEIGNSHTTVAEYYRILQDCMIVDRIEPFTTSNTRRKLNKSPKFLFFDLGIRRLAAEEPFPISEQILPRVFEQFIGIEIIKYIKQTQINAKLMFWRCHSGPEVDYILEYNGKIMPIEIKWTSKPSDKDIRHIRLFNKEYNVDGMAYVICRAKDKLLLDDNILAIPWENLLDIFN